MISLALSLNESSLLSALAVLVRYTDTFDCSTSHGSHTPAAAAAAAEMAKSDVTNYFRRTSLFWIITVTLSVGYFTCIVFAPELIPYEHLGPFGTFCRYLVENHASLMYKGWWAAFVIHVFEALYSQKVCSDKGVHGLSARMLWFFQTFLFGVASLGILLKFDPKRPKQQ